MNTTPPPLDRETALGLLGAVVAEWPDYTYTPVAALDVDDLPRCVYLHRGAPSCVVGRVLARHGWPLEALAPLDDEDGTGAHQLPDAMADAEARELLSRAQIKQDDGRPWSDALAAAAEL